MVYIIINILVLILAVFIVTNGLKSNKKIHLEAGYDHLLPEEINYLYKDMSYLNRAIMVTLLDLFRRGKINIEEYIRESRNKNLADFVVEYKFSLLNKEGLKNHQLVFINNVFQDKLEVTTDQLTKRAVDGEEFLSAQGKWALLIEKELKDSGLLKAEKSKLARNLKILGFIILVFGIFCIINSKIIGLVSLISSMAILLIGLNLSMAKSGKAQSIILNLANKEKLAKENSLSNLSENDLLELLAMATTMKYFLPIYEKSNKYPSIDLVVKTLNSYGGSSFDDAMLRAFMGFTALTRSDTLDTNRIDYRLFK